MKHDSFENLFLSKVQASTHIFKINLLNFGQLDVKGEKFFLPLSWGEM